jgi:hypothetical protein
MRKNNRDRRPGSLCRKDRRSRVERHDHSHLALDEFRRKRCQSPLLIVCPAVFDRHVPALNKTGRAETLTERGYIARI